MALVMLYDLLFGKGSIQGGGELKRRFTSHLPKLKDSIQSLKEEKGYSKEDSDQCLLPSHARRRKFPRYARVNLLRTTVGEAVKALTASGFDPKVRQF
jgi:hypothetical protein